jgi:hypothetical protein
MVSTRMISILNLMKIHYSVENLLESDNIRLACNDTAANSARCSYIGSWGKNTYSLGRKSAENLLKDCHNLSVTFVEY